MDDNLRKAWLGQLKAWYHGRGMYPTDIQLRQGPDGRVIATCQLILPSLPHAYCNEAGQWCLTECETWPAVD